MANIRFEKIDHYENSILFQNQTIDAPPRGLLLKTLKLFSGFNGFAIDLGCGSGFDTMKLIESGWEVLSIDANPNGFENVKSKISKHKLPNVNFRQDYFETLSLPYADLVYSAFGIPFCKPESFDRFWDTIVNAVVETGRFAGNFFGDKDDWSYLNDMTFKSKAQILNLFSDFEIEHFHESLEIGTSLLGNPRKCHVFEIIAKKRSGGVPQLPRTSPKTHIS